MSSIQLPFPSVLRRKQGGHFYQTNDFFGLTNRAMSEKLLKEKWILALSGHKGEPTSQDGSCDLPSAIHNDEQVSAYWLTLLISFVPHPHTTQANWLHGMHDWLSLPLLSGIATKFKFCENQVQVRMIKLGKKAYAHSLPVQLTKKRPIFCHTWTSFIFFI